MSQTEHEKKKSPPIQDIVFSLVRNSLLRIVSNFHRKLKFTLQIIDPFFFILKFLKNLLTFKTF